MSKNGRKFIGAGVVCTILAIILFAAFTSTSSQSGAVKTAVQPVAVEVAPVALTHITETVSAVGTIAAIRDVVVSSETAGRVTQVPVKVGDFVKAGQTLVKVDDELKAIAVEQARAQLLAAETNYTKAQKDFKRVETLFASGDVAVVELEGNRLAMHAAEAQFKSAQVGLKLAQRQFEDTRIKAPIAGFVASKKVEVGEMVSSGREIANIVDVSSLKVKVSIPEEEIGKLRVRQSAILRVDTRPNDRFKGSIYTIGSKTESATGHLYPVEVIMQNPNKDILKVGMFARVEVTSNSAENALVISKESLVGDAASPTVYVVENNLAHIRQIKLGLRSGESYQVTEGLHEGELVISFGQKSLKDGSPVQYRQDK